MDSRLTPSPVALETISTVGRTVQEYGALDSLNLTNASAGMYFLNAADSNGCSVLDTVSIGEPPVLALTIDSTSDLTCYQNADGYLSATVTGGFGSYNYYIDGVAAVSLTIDSLDAGSHVVSVS